MQHDMSFVAVDADAGLSEQVSKRQRLPPLCRNCGNVGHIICKIVFSEEQRAVIKQNHQFQLDERALARKIAKQLERNIPKQVVYKQVVCKNCAEFGHDMCSQIFDESEKTRIRELRELRCPVKVKPSKINPNLPPLVCRNCAELGHSYCKRVFSDIERVEVEEIKKVRRNERAILINALRKSPAALKVQSDKIAEKRKTAVFRETELRYKEKESYRVSRAGINARRYEIQKLLQRVSAQNRLDPQRPEALLPLDELNRVAAEYDFTKYVRNSKDVFRDACPYLSYDWMTNNCCAVCGCDWPKAATTFHAVSDDAFMRKLTPRVLFSEFRKGSMQPEVQAQYCLKVFDSRLENLILCRYGLFTKTQR